MANIKELTQKITSLKNTQKVTKTMKLVSTSKLKRAQIASDKALEYTRELISIALPLIKTEKILHPLLKKELDAENNKILVVVFSSDKGLCGGFNNNLFKKLNKKILGLKNEGKIIDVITCGNRAYNFFSKRFNVIENFPDLASKIQLSKSNQLATKLETFFLSESYQSIYLGYNKFESILKQNPSYECFLPFSFDINDSKNDDTIFEPNQLQIVNFVIPQIIKMKIFSVLLENSVGEHAARMAAMDNATTNGENLINHYSILKNRVRQSSITTELTEIVAGAESLK